MSILTKDEIEKLIAVANDDDKLIKDADPQLISGCSYDLRIGTIFRDGKILRDQSSQILVEPGDTVSIFTLEELQLPDDIAGVAFAINKQSSRGFLVLNPGHVDPGYRGPLTVKAINLTKTSMYISHGLPIFTVIFERLPKPVELYNNNITREKKEQDYIEQELRAAPRGVMIRTDNDLPYTTHHDVEQAIKDHWRGDAKLLVNDAVRKHWMSRAAFFAAMVAAVTGIIAIIIALVK